MKQVNLKVAGMTCGHCVKAVEQALSEVPGAKVESVQLGRVSVATDDSVAVGVLIVGTVAIPVPLEVRDRAVRRVAVGGIEVDRERRRPPRHRR